jgi:mannose-6-phosphate isomerase-like protein (cupin superfamily)
MTTTTNTTTTRVVQAGEGMPVGEGRAAMRIKIGSCDTEGRWALLAGRSAPRFESGLHCHAEGGKGFYVIDGEYEFYADGHWLDLRAGDAVLVPAGAVHGFRAGPQGGSGLVIYPGSQERWFAEVATAGGPEAIGPAATQAISAAHGVAQCGPLPPR